MLLTKPLNQLLIILTLIDRDTHALPRYLNIDGEDSCSVFISAVMHKGGLFIFLLCFYIVLFFYEYN